MSKRKNNLSFYNDNFIQYIESSSDFVLQKDKIYCNTCKKILKVNIKAGISNLKRHQLSKIHQQNLFLISSMSHTKNMTSMTIEDLHKNFLKMLVIANIPINIVDNDYVKKFYLENFNFEIKSAQTYRNKYLNNLENEERLKLKNAFKHKNFVYI